MTQVLFFTTKSVYHLGKVFLSCFSTNHEEAILLVSITINTPFNDIANTEKMFLLSPPVRRTSFNDFLHSLFLYSKLVWYIATILTLLEMHE